MAKKNIDYSKLLDESDAFNTNKSNEKDLENNHNDEKHQPEISTTPEISKEEKGKENLQDFFSRKFDYTIKSTTLLNVSDVTKKMVDSIAFAFDINKKTVIDKIIMSFYEQHKKTIKKHQMKKLKSDI